MAEWLLDKEEKEGIYMTIRTKDIYEQYNQGVQNMLDSFAESVRLFNGIHELEEDWNDQISKIEDSIILDRADLDKREAFCAEEVHNAEIIMKNNCDQAVKEKENYQFSKDVWAYCMQIEDREGEEQKLLQQMEQAESKKEELLHSKKEVPTNEQILKIKEDYRNDDTFKKDCRKDYILHNRRPGGWENEEQLEKELAVMQQSAEKIANTRVQKRLSEEGITEKDLEENTEYQRKLDEISKREMTDMAVMYAKCQILQGDDTWKKKYFFWKKAGMILFCYPRILFGELDNKVWNVRAVLPFLVSLGGAYFFPKLVYILMGAWVLCVSGYFILERNKEDNKQGLKAVGFWNCLYMTLYPLYILVLFKFKILPVVAVLFVIAYFGKDFVFFLITRVPENRKKYKDFIKHYPEIYQNKYEHYEMAKEKYISYQKEEQELVQQTLQKTQEQLKKVSEENREDKTELIKQFEQSEFEQEYLAKIEKTNLDKRDEIIRENLELEEQYHLEEEEIRELKRNLDICRKEKEELVKECNDKKQREIRDAEERCNLAVREAENAFERNKAEIGDELKNLERQREDLQQRYLQRKAEIDVQYSTKCGEYKAAYEQEITDKIRCLEKDGMKEICGFDYAKAWMLMHSMLTSVVGFPPNEKFWNKEYKELLRDITCQGVESVLEPMGKTHFEDSYFMPRHLLAGAKKVDGELPMEIQLKIAEALRKKEQFYDVSQLFQKENIVNLGLKTLPADGLYQLVLIPMTDGASIVLYDSLSQSNEEIRDFIYRNLVMDNYVCHSGNSFPVKYSIVVQEHKATFDTLADKYITAMLSDNHKILTDDRVIKEKIQNLYEDKRERYKQLSDGTDLFQWNINRTNRGRGTENGIYEVLIVVHTDWSVLTSTQLYDLIEFTKDKQVGMYTWLFLDKNSLKGETTENDRNLEVINNFMDKADYDYFALINTKEGNGLSIQSISKDEFKKRISKEEAV